MLVQSKHNVPKPFRRSRDYQILLKLLDIIAVDEKSDIDNFVNLLNADMCPSKYLPLLASYVGYNYNYTLPYEANRVIIKYFPKLVRLRGSLAGLEMAAALAITAQENYSQITNVKNLININYINTDEEQRIDIYIYYPNYLSNIYDLLDVVRPVGINVKVIPSKSLRNPNDDVIAFNVAEYHTRGDLDATNRYVVSEDNEAGFGEVEKILDESIMFTPITRDEENSNG